MLVPAIVKVENSYQMDGGKATETKVSYTIGEEAKVVSTAPTWREYLWREYPYPEAPHRSLLPRTKAEVETWKKSLREGWKGGVYQADENFYDGMSRLTLAVEGRHLYTTLEQQGIFSPASLKIESSRVTFNGRTMNVGETIYSVGTPVQFQGSGEWRPMWTR